MVEKYLLIDVTEEDNQKVISNLRGNYGAEDLDKVLIEFRKNNPIRNIILAKQIRILEKQTVSYIVTDNIEEE